MNIRELSGFERIVAVMLVLLLCGLLGLGGAIALSASGLFTPRAEEPLAQVETATLPLPTATPTATLPPTFTPSPTSTPTPILPTNTPVAIPPTETYTPVPPTDTPGPPTATPVPLTDEERAYLEELTGQMKRWSETIEKSTTLMQAPKLSDEEWSNAIVEELHTWEALGEEARNLQGPARFQALHSKYLIAVEHYTLSAGLLTQAIEEGNAELVASAQEEFDLALEAVEETNKEIERFAGLLQ